jgi:isoleucyl-tRNA synthetase
LRCARIGEAPRLSDGARHVFHALIRWVSPILCFTAEEVWQSRYPEAGSVHLETWPETDAAWLDEALGAKWDLIRELRTRVTEAIEPLRREKMIRSSLEAEVALTLADDGAAEAVSSVDFSEICIVSELSADTGEAEAIAISRTGREKCGRCWRHLPEVSEEGGLCARCDEVVNG